MCIRMYLITHISISIVFNNDILIVAQSTVVADVVAVETFVGPNKDHINYYQLTR